MLFPLYYAGLILQSRITAGKEKDCGRIQGPIKKEMLQIISGLKWLSPIKILLTYCQ